MSVSPLSDLRPVLPAPLVDGLCRPDEGGDQELAALLAARTPEEGFRDAAPGLRLWRVPRPVTFQKAFTGGPHFMVVAQGKKRAAFRDQVLCYEPSRYLLVTGEASFEGAVVAATPERPCLGLCLSIPIEAVARTLLALADADDAAGAATADQIGAEPPAYVAAVDGHLRDAVLRLVRAADDPLERRIVVPMVVDELVFRLFRSDAAAVLRGAVPRGPDAASIGKAMSFIRANAARALSVVDVARHVAMSPSHFAHRFRAVARVSPMRYLKQVRLEEARRLMVAGGVRASEAAGRVGYQSASHFARDFKAIFGEPPAAYVARARAG